MELYINDKWTAILWSENGNHASICTTGGTVEEADAKLIGAL